MRKIAGTVVLIMLLLLCLSTGVAQDMQPQFPFLAQTNELAVNLRSEMDSAGTEVGRLERGQQLTVLAAAINDLDEVWYAVALEDGTFGYIRSDLLIPSELVQAELAEHRAAYGDAQGAYIGNRRTKKFHLPTCHTLPKESNRVYFDARSEAIDNGFDPCGNCHP